MQLRDVIPRLLGIFQTFMTGGYQNIDLRIRGKSYTFLFTLEIPI